MRFQSYSFLHRQPQGSTLHSPLINQLYHICYQLLQWFVLFNLFYKSLTCLTYCRCPDIANLFPLVDSIRKKFFIRVKSR